MHRKSLFWNGTIVGEIVDLKGENTHYYGNWVPASEALGEKLQSALRDEDNGGPPVIVTFGDTARACVVTAIENGTIDIRPLFEPPPRKWWQFWK